VDKRQLGERDICSKFITPAVTAAGRQTLLQIREEVSFTQGSRYRPREARQGAMSEVDRDFVIFLESSDQSIQATGAITAKAAAAALNTRHVRPTRGGAWYSSTVRRLLARA
jgi:hypothetical protein